MTIGQIIKEKRYDSWVRLQAFIQSKPKPKIKTSFKETDRLMREIPGFDKQERLPKTNI